MTEPNAHGAHGSDLFLRFSRRRLLWTLVLVLLLGTTGLALMLSPPGTVARSTNLAWWLIPVLIALVVLVHTVQTSRREGWSSDSPEAMAAATLTIGLATFIALLLVFDRE